MISNFYHLFRIQNKKTEIVLSFTQKNANAMALNNLGGNTLLVSDG